MTTPVVWVTATLIAAIVLTASLVIATASRDDDTSLGGHVLRLAPAKK